MLKDRIKVNGMEYVLVGDCYLPNIPLTDDEIGIGFYGRKRLNFMREYRREEYEELLRSNALQNYLKEFEDTVQNCKRKLLLQRLHNEGLMNKDEQKVSIEWMRKIHIIYTEIDVILRAKYVYA